MPERVLLTGGAGFVGSHVVRHFLTETDVELILPITLRHRGNGDRLRVAVEGNPEWWDRLHISYHDLRGPFSLTEIERFGQVDAIINLASESHVDRSIEAPGPFIQNNVELIINMLELARILRPRMFLQISTDEVYGPAYGRHLHAEWSSIVPSNPYSASKAAQEAICTSYWRTYNVPLVLTNTMNIIGETQDREKFLPMLIRASQSGETVPIHVDERGWSGSRFYLHARNQADALLWVLRHVHPRLHPHRLPERFNVVGEREVTNIELADLVAKFTGKKIDTRPVEFHATRPGHDLRYALNGQKLASYGWQAPVPFEDSLQKTVSWTLEHPEWLL